MDESVQQTPSFGESHAATHLLRDLIDLTGDFERLVGAELEVNPTDFTAMQHLIVAGPLSPTALADRLELSTAAVTTVIDRLEASGHAHRIRNPDDRRGTLVVPEPASIRRAMSSIVPMVSAVDDAVREFSPDEQEVIVRYLRAVVDAYRDRVPQPERAGSRSAGSSASESASADAPVAG